MPAIWRKSSATVLFFTVMSATGQSVIFRFDADTCVVTFYPEDTNEDIKTADMYLAYVGLREAKKNFVSVASPTTQFPDSIKTMLENMAGENYPVAAPWAAPLSSISFLA
eukprot:GHVT01024502.1.p2 GENE.GHVT01024502.1~~GHVT01024502.1.p2  ORF type:complete len:110 (+),score=4.94 GHVT01024502.1:358-687(+)